jgi:hypothetical protein
MEDEKHVKLEESLAGSLLRCTEFIVGLTLPVLTLSRCFGVGLITLNRRNPSYPSSKSSCRAAPDRILPLWLNCLYQSGEFQA